MVGPILIIVLLLLVVIIVLQLVVLVGSITEKSHIHEHCHSGIQHGLIGPSELFTGTADPIGMGTYRGGIHVRG